VLDAIAAGDGTAAERLMRAAIERFRDELTRTLRRSPAVEDLPLSSDPSNTGGVPTS
jgi:DNA-binding GntR family transcriptional regulator